MDVKSISSHFDESYMNPYAARHSSVESFGALPRGFKSMSLDKAAELINTLLTQWLQTKH